MHECTLRVYPPVQWCVHQEAALPGPAVEEAASACQVEGHALSGVPLQGGGRGGELQTGVHVQGGLGALRQTRAARQTPGAEAGGTHRAPTPRTPPVLRVMYAAMLRLLLLLLLVMMMGMMLLMMMLRGGVVVMTRRPGQLPGFSLDVYAAGTPGGSSLHSTLPSGITPRAGFTVFYQHRHSHPLGGGRGHFTVLILLVLVFLWLLRLIAMILEPDFHLCGAQAYHRGQVLPLRGGQVLLLLEPPLQLVDLRLREQDAPLPSLRQGEGHAGVALMIQTPECTHPHGVHTRRRRHAARTGTHQAGYWNNQTSTPLKHETLDICYIPASTKN